MTTLTADMVREALAHAPLALSSPERWQWLADRLNQALADPGAICPCCNVTADGDVMDHLPAPSAPPQDIDTLADEFMSAFNCEAELSSGARIYNDDKPHVVEALRTVLRTKNVDRQGLPASEEPGHPGSEGSEPAA